MSRNIYDEMKAMLLNFNDDMIEFIERAEDEHVGLQEQLDYEIQDKEDNYRHLTPAELIDWSDRW